MPSQTDNGKAFEYSIANEYYCHLRSLGLNVNLIQDGAFGIVQSKYALLGPPVQPRFDLAARQTIQTLLTLEPGLTVQQNANDVLTIRVATDAEGQAGDVRDVIFKRPHAASKWEIGISAKNNHDAVKHSRLSPTINFGRDWVGTTCSNLYFTAINPIFAYISAQLQLNPGATWASLGSSKEARVYQPLLAAFRDEMRRLAKQNANVPVLLLQYLVGRYAFYKVIKDDSNNCVVVKAFNLKKGLNRSVGSVAPKHFADPINFPSRIIEFDFVAGSNTTLRMILDHGWQISFRIHNASSKLETSLKFDINLIGNPPVLFTQHLFI